MAMDGNANGLLNVEEMRSDDTASDNVLRCDAMRCGYDVEDMAGRVVLSDLWMDVIT